MTRHDRRWVILATGLLAVWLQVLTPFILVGGMRAGMASELAAIDAIDYLCLPINLDANKAGHGKHLHRLDCQLCQNLQAIAQGLTPDITVFVQPSLQTLKVQETAETLVDLPQAQHGFSSRAPPVLQDV